MTPINSVGSGIRTLGTTPLQQAQLNKLSGGVLFANNRTSATGETPRTQSPAVMAFYEASADVKKPENQIADGFYATNTQQYYETAV